MHTFSIPVAVIALVLTSGAQARGQGADAAGSGAQQNAPAALTVFDAHGYRTARYRAPVDRDPAPARRMSAQAALRLEPGRDALFLDVLPVDGGVRDPRTGEWHLSVPHATIPGALWYPETGRGAPDPQLWAALREAVAQTRARHPEWPVVLFCRADCWMGWNAARRLASEGVTRVYWYGEGIDGWYRAGHDLSPVSPVPVRPRGPAGASG